MAYLINLGDSRQIPIEGDRLIIGRSRSADFVIDHERVSKRHAMLQPSADGWTLEDLGSSNGTTVNGERCRTPVMLHTDDIIEIGRCRLQFKHGTPGDEVVTVIENTEVASVLAGEISDQESRRRLRLFLEIAAALDSFASPEVLLSRCGGLVVHIFEPSCCMLKVGDQVWSYTGKKKQPLSLSETVVSRVRERGEALLATDVANDANLRNADSIRYLKIRSAMGAPIVAGNEPVGLIYVDQRRIERQFGEEDLLFLIGVGRLVGSAVAGSNRFSRLDAENRMLKASREKDGTIVGDSPSMRELRETVEKRIGPVKANVLLLGETGTGKSLVAEAIHLASPRRSGPFIKVNCAAIPRDLVESELFGHEKGAFSGAVKRKPGYFELASGGSLFLDEIGELDSKSQAKLLAVIQDQKLYRVGGTRPVETDVRIIAATNRDLKKAVENSQFRPDLYYRLNVVRLEIPPLSARKDDIPKLVRHFLAKVCSDMGRKVQGVTPEAMERLVSYAWPGNIRELANCIERAVIFCDESGQLGVEQLPHEIRSQVASPAIQQAQGTHDERELVANALRQAGGNKREAARLLGWYPQKLYSRLKKYQLGDLGSD